MWFIITGILLVIIIILSSKLNKKQKLDEDRVNEYNKEIEELSSKHGHLKATVDNDQRALRDVENKLNSIRNDLARIQREYNEVFAHKNTDLNQYFDNLRAQKQEQLDEDFERQVADKQQLIQNADEECKSKIALIQSDTEETIAIYLEQKKRCEEEAEFLQQKYNALIEPLKKYEMEQQQRLFYTIQVPDEYKEDIDYLITNVSQKIQHPDIINKLVWNEYVKPYIDDTFRRVGIEDKPGIYKITNIQSGKAYVGKSTNMKKRLADHFKSSIGIKTIADQAVHHEIWKTGFWNWMIEPVIYSDKDKLNELEKYYIDFFDTVNNGYNKNAGGGG